MPIRGRVPHALGCRILSFWEGRSHRLSIGWPRGTEVIRSWLNPVSVSALTTSGILLRYATKNINGAPAALQISLPKLGRVGQLLDTARLPPRSMHLDMPLDYLVNDLQTQGA